MKIAIIGASGAVGREMIEDLASSKLTNVELRLFASPRSAGTVMAFRGQNLTIEPFSLSAMKGIPYALMSAGSAFSKEYSEELLKIGCTVIDNSSAWRMDQRFPLVVPEVNGGELQKVQGPVIIANPNCSTIQLVVALEPLRRAFGLEMVQAATYQSVSGTGQKGIEELASQMEAHYKFREIEPKVYAQPIAFNLLAAIDKIDTCGHAFEEEKMVRESRKIFSLPELAIMVTTVRVPVFNCHCETVSVKMKRQVSLEEAVAVMKEGEGLTLVHPGNHSNFPTPRSVTGERGVWVSRMRLPIDCARSEWLQFWVVADNLKKGAATNAVQILEKLCL